jgi:ABC-type branched-subunit amino acid transport system ATPase component
MPGDAGALLRVEQLTRRFGGVVAVDGLSFELGAGEKLAVIGPNGAGKSTLLRLIAGQDRPSSGRILLSGAGEVQGMAAHRLARIGVALARQVPRPPASPTVRENVQLGAPAGHHRDPRPARERVDEVLARTGLDRVESRAAGSLALLDLKRLEVARALISSPRILLLDEVSAGLNEADLDDAIRMVADINASGTALLIVEHVQRVIHELADRVLVLNWGTLLAEGTPTEVSADEEVRRVYLGAGRPDAPASRRAPAAAPAPGSGVQLEAVTVTRGSLLALSDVDFRIERGEVVAVLGANGAGKSTLAQSISGLLRAQSGTITWEGADVTRWASHLRARAGIAHCQEGRKLFPGLTVVENLTLGAFGATRAQTAERMSAAFELFPVLRDRAKQVATTMSGGQQQMVAIARALMSAPRLLVCDEVTLGLSPKVADEIYLALERVAESGTSLLLIEQDAERCLSAADRAYVLQRGRVSWTGPAHELGQATLVAAYLGGDAPPSA